MLTGNKRDGSPLVVVRLEGSSVGSGFCDGFGEDRSPFLELVARLRGRAGNSDRVPSDALQNGDSGRAGQRTVLTGNKRDGSPLAVVLVPLRPRISKFLTIIGFSVDTVCIRSRGRPAARSEVAGEGCRADHAGGRRIGRGTINRPIAAAVLQSKPFHNGVACFVAPGAAVNLKGDLDLVLIRHTVRAIGAVVAVAVLVLLIVDVQDVLGRILDERQFKISGRSRGVENIVAACRLLIRGRDLVTDRAAAGFRLGLVFYIIYIIINSVVSRGGFRPLRVQIDVLLLDGIGREVPLRAVCAGVGGVPAAEGVALPRGIVRLGELIAGLQILLRMIGIRFFVVVPVIRRRICRRIPAGLLPDRIKRLGLGLAVASIEEDFLTFLAGVCARRIVRRACVRVLVPAEERVAVARRLIDAHIERILAVVHCNVRPRVRRRNADPLRAGVGVVLQRKRIIALLLGLEVVGVRIPLLIHEVDASLVIGNLDRADRDRFPDLPFVRKDVAVIEVDFICIEPRLGRGFVVQRIDPVPVEADRGLPEPVMLSLGIHIFLTQPGVLCRLRQSAVLNDIEGFLLVQIGQVKAIGLVRVLLQKIKDTARAALVPVDIKRVDMGELCLVCNLDHGILIPDRDFVFVSAAIFNSCVAADELDVRCFIQQ